MWPGEKDEEVMILQLSAAERAAERRLLRGPPSHFRRALVAVRWMRLVRLWHSPSCREWFLVNAITSTKAVYFVGNGPPGMIRPIAYDSGATLSAWPRSYVQQDVLPLRGGNDPMAYGADGTKLEYYGDREVKLTARNGSQVVVSFRVLNVEKALVSDDEIQKSHRVFLDKVEKVGYLESRSDGTIFPLVHYNKMWWFDAQYNEISAVDADQPMEEQMEQMEQLPNPIDPQRGDKPLPLPKVGRLPKTPSAAERRAHDATHTPHQDWCPTCVAARGQADQHRRLAPVSEMPTRKPVIQIDYSFCRTEPNGYQLTLLSMVFVDVGGGWTNVVPQKGVHQYSIDLLIAFVEHLGLAEVIVQADAASDILAVAKVFATQAKSKGISVSTRAAPVGSHASQGMVERWIGKTTATSRALVLQFNRRLGRPLRGEEEIVSWIIRQAGYLTYCYADHTGHGSPY